MRVAFTLGFFILALGTACGSTKDNSSGPAINAFTGTVVVSAANTGSCATPHDVLFTDIGTDVHSVNVAGGDCVRFINNGTAQHWPVARAATGCSEFSAPAALAASGGSYTTPVLSGPKSCDWIDALFPPGSGGGY